MDYYSNRVSRLIEELSHLPGIGAKISGKAGISFDPYAGR